MKLIRLDVFRWASADCTNGGISSKEKQIYLKHPNGIEFTPEEISKLPKGSIFYSEKCGDDYIRLKEHDTKKWGMFGGNVAAVCHMDKERAKGLVGKLLHIHDRYETSEQSAALSI